MPSTDNQFDSLGEKAKLVNLALKYTRGDQEKARQIVSGQISDIVAVKGRASMDSSLFCIFVIFINTEFGYIMNANAALFASKPQYDKVRISSGWKSFSSEIAKTLQANKSEPGSASDPYPLIQHLLASVDGYQIYEDVKNLNMDVVTEIVREIFQKYRDYQSAQLQIDLEKTNSIMVDLEGIPLEPPPEYGETRQEESASDSSQETDLEKQSREIESQAEFVIEGKVIVSPVKGKYINDIKPGEYIQILPTNVLDEISIKVARTLKAYTSDHEFLPIKARLKAKLPLEGGGCILYGLPLKNILVKVIEEENVKIEMYNPGNAPNTVESDSKSLLIYIGLLIGLIVSAIAIIMILV